MSLLFPYNIDTPQLFWCIVDASLFTSGITKVKLGVAAGVAKQLFSERFKKINIFSSNIEYQKHLLTEE